MLVAFLALQILPDAALPPFKGQHPGPTHERRLMAHVLPVPAGQVGDPIALLILMKVDDGLIHRTQNVRLDPCPRHLSGRIKS